MKLRSLFTIALLFVVNSVFANEGAHEGLADQVLEKVGLYEIISSFPEQIEAQFAQQSPFSTNQEASRKAAEALISSFNEHEAKAYMLEYAIKNTKVEELEKMLVWLNSPLGTRFTASEIEAGTVEGQSNLMRYAADLNSNPPSQERVLLIQEYEQKAQLTKNVLEVIKAMMIGAAKGINMAVPEPEKLSDQEVEAKMAEVVGNMMPMMERMMWQQMLITAHYMYRDFSEKEIREYIAFLQSSEGQRYISLGQGAGEVFGRIINESFIDMVQENEHSN